MSAPQLNSEPCPTETALRRGAEVIRHQLEYGHYYGNDETGDIIASWLESCADLQADPHISAAIKIATSAHALKFALAVSPSNG